MLRRASSAQHFIAFSGGAKQLHKKINYHEGDGAFPCDMYVKGVVYDTVDDPPVHEQGGKTVLTKEDNQRIHEMFLLWLFMQGQGEDAAGHEER